MGIMGGMDILCCRGNVCHRKNILLSMGCKDRVLGEIYFFMNLGDMGCEWGDAYHI